MTPFLALCAIATLFQKDYNDFQNLVYSGLTTEQAVAKLQTDRKPRTGAEYYLFLQSVWEIIIM